VQKKVIRENADPALIAFAEALFRLFAEKNEELVLDIGGPVKSEK
jgi:stalled ribosome alternative rescue factor ArfA